MEDIKKNSETEIVESEVKNETVEAEAASSSQSETADNKKAKKAKKDKEPMPKKKKIIIITAASILGVIVLGLFIWLMVFLFGPSATQSLNTVPLKVEMSDTYYIGTEGQVDYSKIFPNSSDWKLEGNTLTFKQDGKTITKNVTTIDGAVNVNNFDDLVANINAGKKVVIQNASLKAPKLEGTNKDEVPTMTVKNDVYGNGAVINVYELVVTREKEPEKNGNKLAKPTNGTDYKKSSYGNGYSAFTISPNENGTQVIFQDVHIVGNDLSAEEGGNLSGLDEKTIEARGVKLFSGYGELLYIAGNSEAKANALVKHCVIENGHKVVHIRNSKVDIEGTIIRNAADTAISIATFESEASTVKSKDNVIINSLTGGILFYSFEPIAKAKEAESWNKLTIEGFLDIYNWKKEKGLAFLPETEGVLLAKIANEIASSEVVKTEFDDLKAKVQGDKYIHFAIIKIRTNNSGVAYNGSTVEGADKIGYSTSKENGLENGFPIPDIAKNIMFDIEVWGYYKDNKNSVSPTDNFTEDNLSKIYKELREGRK